MKIIKYILTGWSALVFMIGMLIGAPVFFLADLIFGSVKGAKYMMKYNTWWGKAWKFLSLVNLKVVGAEKVEAEKSYVFTANHVSMLDAIMIVSAVDRPLSPLAKIELKKIPVLGYLFLKLGVFVDRSDKESRRESMKKLLEKTQNNISILVFPEGTRNKNAATTPLKSFYSGAFRVAIDVQIPIVPLVFVGIHETFPNEKPPMNLPSKVTAIYGDPIPTIGLTMDDMPTLKQQIFEVMQQLLIDNDPKYKRFKIAEKI